MFPESFVRRNVLAWSKRDDVIFDPFSGRGTTVLESLLSGRKGLGCDTNPVAVCLSKAKADPPHFQEVCDRVALLQRKYEGFASKEPEVSDEFFTLCFHKATLQQLLFLKRKLDWRDDRVDRFIAALALGCLHGESHRTELCFSNRMPRTISTKPAYSVRWWRQRGCRPPERDVFSILKKCAEYRYQSPVPLLKGRVVEGDARRASTLLRSYREKVKLVVTSPPYLDITDYHEDQWLRLWFLGGARKPIAGQGRDDRHRRVEAYWKFLCEAWRGVAPLLQDSAQVVIRIGGTRLGGEELRVGLLHSLNLSGRKFILKEARQTVIRNGQRRIFQTVPAKASVEYDFRFTAA
ncbi:MAG TPA: DNA methyltransferase [Candidatus Acidoferrales bacterium]|nr:DNA methyltransferase [Candidatus Acidoferrales bacterium]